MMTATHGIVDSLGPPVPDTFETIGTGFLVDDIIRFDVSADIGDVIRVDFGDGIAVNTVISTLPETIQGNLVDSVNFSIKSTGNVSKILFDSIFNNYNTIDITISDTITAIDSSFASLNRLTSFNMANASNVIFANFSWQNCNSLISFPAIDLSSASFLQQAWQNCNSLTSFPAIDLSSALDLDLAWQGCTLMESMGDTNTSSGTSFFETLKDCTSLICVSSINTLLQVSTTGLFTNTPALVAPTAGEQTSILAGFNYVNAGACP